MKKAVVTGCPGQDGSYLSEYLLSLGYNVIGVSRRSDRQSTNMAIAEQNPNFKSVLLDITDGSGVRNLIESEKPDEFYHLAALTHVRQSFYEPLAVLETNAASVINILEAIRTKSRHTKLYFAATSEMYGNNYEYGSIKTLGVRDKYQNESTLMTPRSPYAAAKLYAYNMCNLYRSSYGLHISCGILFNHGSPRRSLDFIERKICYNIARIKVGLQKTISLGNLEAYRDFGHSKDYVKAMHLMLQQPQSDNYVVATGEAVSIKQLFEFVCKLADVDPGKVYKADPSQLRPAEVDYLRGDSTRIQKIGWETEYLWQELVTEIYQNDLEAAKKEAGVSLEIYSN